VRRVYGHDFLGYAEASLKRRLMHWLAASPFESLAKAQASVLGDARVFRSLLEGITINVTEMFRDPAFFQALREHVIPSLRHHRVIKIWHAGCATGEEAYSMAILLRECGLEGRYRIYATDINPAVLERARAGIYPQKAMQAATRNYHASGGVGSFADYYTARYERVLFDRELRDNLVFGHHDLASGTDLGEMHLVLCRNVMIYFTAALKQRCLTLIDNGLLPGGFLCLGAREKMGAGRDVPGYMQVRQGPGMYRKLHE
jgi:chemotaxis protein methyltransferase CheR